LKAVVWSRPNAWPTAKTSIAKTFGAEAVNRFVDRCAQMCGGLGVSEDLPLARIARKVRPFRIYDGPSKVRRWSLAKRTLRQVMPVKS
jgi:alkylation response protein AidB-like acyl-CoA dehydrogenase